MVIVLDVPSDLLHSFSSGVLANELRVVAALTRKWCGSFLELGSTNACSNMLGLAVALATEFVARLVFVADDGAGFVVIIVFELCRVEVDWFSVVVSGVLLDSVDSVTVGVLVDELFVATKVVSVLQLHSVFDVEAVVSSAFPERFILVEIT